jgi:hypothetical protein
MKKLTYLLIGTILVSASLWLALAGRAAPSASTTQMEPVWRAYGGRQAIASVHAFLAQFVRLTSTVPPEIIESRQTVAVEGPHSRRERVDPHNLTSHVELMNGAVGWKAVPAGELNALAGRLQPMDADQVRAAKFAVETSGLLPMLKACMDPAAEARFLERTPMLLDKFAVTTAGGQWFVYADALSHLIRRVDMGDKTFQFADYRSVDGLQLPFIQRLYVGDRLVYELIFSTIELNPTFAAGHFSKEALLREVAR